MTPKLTPAMRQYLEVKEANPDSIIFFRMGDFYEMFFEDAKEASRVLGIALTSRDKDRKIPMCGLPYHAATQYISKLIDSGYKVAVCEQITDPKESKGIVERAVTRIVTPGTVLDEALIDEKTNTFIASVYCKGGGKGGGGGLSRGQGLSVMDLSTGDFRITEFDSMEELNEELKRTSPREVLYSDKGGPIPGASTSTSPSTRVTLIDSNDFSLREATEGITGHYKVHSLDGLGLKGYDAGVRAAGALLKYAKDTQRSDLSHIKVPAPYTRSEYLLIDEGTERNLDLWSSTGTNTREGSLIETLDHTVTAMGARCLTSFLAFPLKDVRAIRDRLDGVEELFQERALRQDLREALGGIYDLERLIGRVAASIASPRDLISLKLSLIRCSEVKDGFGGSFKSDILKGATGGIEELSEVITLIEESIKDEPPANIRDGGVIKGSFNEALDELREVGSGGKEWLKGYEERERERTGIQSLKLGFNKVFGYYVEISKSKLDKIPDGYIGKQTLVNAERFITEDLKEWEVKILSAEDDCKVLEEKIYREIIGKIAAYINPIQGTARSIGTIDSLISLAHVAERNSYVRPHIEDTECLKVCGGRHPVLEKVVTEGGGENFVPNDCEIGGEESRIHIITGPNMAGKSTYLRQNALIILMAQMGSFVPAASASVGVVDRLFSRVGASDDLSRGQSTFMVEMNEAANILNNSTERSFIILDEIGRGTSTFDGLSIAWSVVEFLHDAPGKGAKTLFATHYHELTDLSLTKERVKNYNMAVSEWEDSIVFLKKVVPGGSSRSYGIQVARLAGLPEVVIERAREILKNLESEELTDMGMPRVAAHSRPAVTAGKGPALNGQVEEGPIGGQLSLLGEGDKVKEALNEITPNNMTPIEALTALYKLKALLDDEE